MPDTTHEHEIDCPYFDSQWVIDHPDWPPDPRLTSRTAPAEARSSGDA